MQVTEIRVMLISEGAGRLRAILSFTFDDLIAINDIKIIDSDNGLFLAMPSKQLPDGSFRDSAHPVSREARDAFERLALGAYLAASQDGSQRCTYRMGARQCSLTEQEFEDFEISN